MCVSSEESLCHVVPSPPLPACVPNLATLPSWSTTVMPSTWSFVEPWRSVCAPEALVPTLPPIVQKSPLEGSGPSLSPAPRAAFCTRLWIAPGSTRTSRRFIHLQNPIHVRREIEDDPGAQRLAGEARPAAARRHGNAVCVRERHGGSYVRFAPGRDHGEGFAPEDAGCRGEESQRDRVGPHLPLEERPELALDFQLSWVHGSP